MKTIIKTFLIATIILFTNNIKAQEIIDANGDIIATMNSSGILVDGVNQPLGEFSTNGDVKNGEGQIIGSIVGNDFKDAAGLILGSIDVNNNVHDMNNSVVGVIQAEVMVIDANNHVLGRSSAPIDSKKLAAYFFFFFGMGAM